MLEWTTDENGERFPVYTAEQAQRIARAAWSVHYLLPHADEVAESYAANLREFHRALAGVPPLPKKSEREEKKEK